MKPRKGASPLVIIVIIVATLIILAIAFYLWFVYRSGGNGNYNPMKTLPTSAKIDAALVGTWETDCLVPTQHNNWAEQHKIIIQKNGSAVHTRLDWGNEACSGTPTGTITDGFTLSIPSSGKIDFTWTSYNNTRLNEMGKVTIGNYTVSADQFKPGTKMYDIYQVSANTLKFGNGFRGDNAVWGNKSGGSEGDRFDTLNDFILYKKK